MDRLAGSNLKRPSPGSTINDDLTVEITLLSPDGQFLSRSAYSRSRSSAEDFVGTTSIKQDGTGAFKLTAYNQATSDVRSQSGLVGWQAIPRQAEYTFSEDLATLVSVSGRAADAITSSPWSAATPSSTTATSACRPSWIRSPSDLDELRGDFTVKVRQAVALGMTAGLDRHDPQGKGDIANDPDR